MLNTKMKINVFPILCFILFVSFLPFSGFAADDSPPYLVSPIPKPNSTVDPYVRIKVGVFDDNTGVNPGTIQMFVQGIPVVEPIIEPSDNTFKNYYVGYPSDNPLPAGEVVVVRIIAEDNAQPANAMDQSWQFAVTSMGFNAKLTPIYPPNCAWLDFECETGLLRFTWSRAIESDYYRLFFKISEKDYYSDFGPIEESPFGLVPVEIELEASDWAILSSVGEISWKVAPIDNLGGQILREFSDANIALYIKGNYPLLNNPVTGAILDKNIAPCLNWNPIEPVDYYYLVMIRFDEQMHYTNDFRIEEIPFFINTMKVSQSTWDTLKSGCWAWTVVGVLPGGQYSDFMRYYFTKQE